MYFFPPKIQFIQWLLHLKNKMQELFSEMQSGSFQRINENLIKTRCQPRMFLMFLLRFNPARCHLSYTTRIASHSIFFQVLDGTMKCRITQKLEQITLKLKISDVLMLKKKGLAFFSVKTWYLLCCSVWRRTALMV